MNTKDALDYIQMLARHLKDSGLPLAARELMIARNTLARAVAKTGAVS